jgi:hypothetical protein
MNARSLVLILIGIVLGLYVVPRVAPGLIV